MKSISINITTSTSTLEGEPMKSEGNQTRPWGPGLAAMSQAPRCHAKTKTGQGRLCRSAAMRGKRVCRMHGGKGGAPKGVKHGAYKHGGWTNEAVALRRTASRLLKAIGESDHDRT